jgi:hypothetical protein
MTMRKIFVFLMFAANAGVAAACCYRYSRYDYSSNSYKTCGSFYTSSNVANGDIVFDSFPYVSTCSRWSCSASWSGSWTNLCAGYYSQYASGTNRARFSPIPDTGGRCWRWQCSGGYIQGTGGICQTLEEKCASLGLVVRNGMCSPKWCSGWESGFNSGAHYEVANGSCNQWRCKAGNGFASVSDHVTCRACVPVQGTRGGCYINDGPASGPTATEWVYVQCNSSQYVNKSGGRWECRAVDSTGDPTIKGCWKCADKASMMKCLRGQGACG